jgi:hypothetical protein
MIGSSGDTAQTGDQMENRTAVLLAFVLLCGTLVFAQEFQIKGDALGMTVTDFAAKYPTCDLVMTSDGTRSCAFRPNDAISRAMVHAVMQQNTAEAKRLEATQLTIGGSYVASITARFYEDKLFQISYYTLSSQYDDLKAALRSKFGEPRAVATSTVQNGFGARYDGDETFWSNGKVVMVLSQRSLLNVNWPMLTLTLKSVADAVANKNQTKAKSDL